MSLFEAINARAGFLTGGPIRAAFAAIARNFAKLEPSVTTSAAADYAPVLTDRVILRSRGSAQTVTIPLNATTAFPIGTQIAVIQTGAGALTVAPVSGGVTINKRAFYTLVAAGQYARIVLTKVAADVWNLSGDLTAA